MTTPTERRLSDALRDIVSNQPFEPDPEIIEQRGRRLARRAVRVRVAGTGVAVVAAAVATGVAIPPHMTAGKPIAAPIPHPTHTSTAVPPAQQLVNLAADLQAAPMPPGDATLVERDQYYSTGERVIVWDLYGDNGTYYFAKTRDGMPAQVAGHHDQGDGVFGREVAAATYAATGDLTKARQQMADAPDPTQHTSSSNEKLMDNWVWEDSLDALTAGAGNPEVRAGVLRLISTLPGVTVTHGSTGGQATLSLTASGPEVAGYPETLIINATTGVPMAYHSGPAGVTPAPVNAEYQVSRVTLANVAAGRF
jgi:hypothetical protein